MAAIVGLLVLWAWLGRAYAAVWQSDLTLWLHAAVHAPTKPRPWVNLAVALMEARRFDEAWLALQQAEDASQQPSRPAWDRAEAERAILQNRLLLSRIDPKNPR